MLQHNQCDQIWRNVATLATCNGLFKHMTIFLEYFGSLSKVFLVFGQILKPLWQNFYAIGQIFVIVIVQM